MSLDLKLISLAQAMGADVKALRAASGALSTLETAAKGNLVGAINELYALDATRAVVNDSAGEGQTAVTWSANKIYASIEAAKTAVRNSLINGASAALDTLAELSAALNNDPAFAATLATALGNRVRFDELQTLTAGQQAQARSNLGAASTASLGDLDLDLVTYYSAAKV